MTSIVALIIGKDGSKGLPGKNVMPILGRPMCEYALMAAADHPDIEKIYTYTDSAKINSIADDYGAFWLVHPEAGKERLTENALLHAWEDMNPKPDIVCLFFANSPCIDVGMVSNGLYVLTNTPELDSCVSISSFPMFEPNRARHIDNVYLKQTSPMVGGDSIRGSGQGVYFVDFTVQIIRARCFEHMWEGSLPFRWHGQQIHGMVNPSPSFDVDAEWQIPVIEYNLKLLGFTHDITPYDGGVDI